MSVTSVVHCVSDVHLNVGYIRGALCLGCPLEYLLHQHDTESTHFFIFEFPVSKLYACLATFGLLPVIDMLAVRLKILCVSQLAFPN